MSYSNDLYYRCKVLDRLKYLDWESFEITGQNHEDEYVTLKVRPDKTVAVIFDDCFEEDYTLENLPKFYMDWVLERTLSYCERQALVEVELEEQRELDRVRQHKAYAKLREKNLL